MLSDPRLTPVATLARTLLKHSNRGTGRAYWRSVMLYYAGIFFIVAIVAAIFGFGGIAAGAVEIAKILFFIFLVLFVVSLIWGLMRRNP